MEPWEERSHSKQSAFKEEKLVPPQYRHTELKKDYDAMKDMLMGDAPSMQDIMVFLAELEQEINAM